MRKRLLLWLVFLPASSAFAQLGAPPLVRPIPRAGMAGPGFRSESRAPFGRRSGSSFYPSYFGDYDYGYGYSGYAPAPNVVVVQQPAPYIMLPEAPPEPARPEIHEYGSGAPAPVPSPDEESAAFTIVLKDGSVRSAVAVAVQDNMVHLVEPDGRHGRVSLDAVDRDATRRRNRERHMELQLPAPER